MENDTKSRILWSAMELLIQKEISQITTREVAKKAGISISQLHYHYKTKNELFSTALVTVTKEYFRKWVDETINFIEPTKSDLECYFSYIVENPFKFPSVCKSKIYMILQGIDIDYLHIGFVEDLKRLLTKLLPQLSKVKINEKVHILTLVATSLRVTTSNIKKDLGYDYSKEVDRKEYSKVLLKNTIPELY